MNRRCDMPLVVTFVLASYSAVFVAAAHVALHLYDKLKGGKA